MRRKNLQQLGKYLRIAADEVAAGQVVRLAGEVADEAAGFGDQQRAGRHVPWAQAEFPEAVEATRGDIGQVERGGAWTAQAGSFLRQVAKNRQVGVDVIEAAVGETSADQRFFELGALRDADALFVEEGAAALAGGEQVVARRVEDDCVGEDVLVRQSY